VNFKNTKYGELQFPRVSNPDSKDVLGVYGQNGSGKTAIIDAMELVQKLMIGESLLEDAGHYIMANQKHMQISVSFDMSYKMIEYVLDYEVTIKKEEDKCLIDSEEIKYKKKNEDEFSRKKTLFKYSDSKKKPLTPKIKVDKLSKYSFNDVSNKINIMVINELIRKESKSYLFNSMFMGMLGEYKNGFEEEYCILKGLNRYANINLFIISSKNSGAIDFKFFIPVNFKITENNHVSKGEIPLMLEKPTFINDRQLEIVEKIIGCMNIAVKKIIPGMTVEILNLGKEVVDVKDNGEEVILNKLELFSNREGIRIPLKFESHGILKILSIINVLINVYNEEDMTL
ncbi:MAG: AAA family ATPase, partial [Staphylococcus sp.]|nr:AAA family ATPase [Staphylococcus sp.]